MGDWPGPPRSWASSGLVLGMIMVPVYLFFFLKDSAAIRTHWHDYVPLKASRFKTELVDTLQEINGYLISFFRGQVLVAAIDGILVGIALTIFGLPYGLLIGVFMAILGVIPYIGNILCLIPACIIAYLHAQGRAPFGMEPVGLRRLRGRHLRRRPTDQLAGHRTQNRRRFGGTPSRSPSSSRCCSGRWCWEASSARCWPCP